MAGLEHGIDRDLINNGSGDLSTRSEQRFGEQKKEERTWGPGVKEYYYDTMVSLKKNLQTDSEAAEKAEVALKGVLSELLDGARNFTKSAVSLFSNGERTAQRVKGSAKPSLERCEQGEKVAVKSAIESGELLMGLGDIGLDAKSLVAEKFSGEEAASSEMDPVHEGEEWRRLTAPLSEKINTLVNEVEGSLEEGKIENPRMRGIVHSLKELDKELQKEKPSWMRLQLLVQLICVELQQDRTFNEKVAEQHSLDSQHKGVGKVAESYNSKVEVTIGVVVGIASVIGGLATGGAGVFGIFGIGTKAFMDGLQGVGQGVSTVARGAGDPAQNFARSGKEAERQLQNYIIECSRNSKETAKSGGDSARGSKGGVMQQRNSAIEAYHRAFTAIANAQG